MTDTKKNNPEKKLIHFFQNESIAHCSPRTITKMSATTENTQLMNLFEKFVKDASKLVNIKKDTDCLLSQIIAHMATDECHTSAIQHLERIFQRPFDSVHTEEPLTIDIDAANSAPSPVKKQKKTKAKKSELNSPAPEPLANEPKGTEPKTKGKPGRKPKASAPVEEEPALDLVAPVIASACATPVLEEVDKPKAKKVKNVKETPVESEEAKPKTKKVKKVKDASIETEVDEPKPKTKKTKKAIEEKPIEEKPIEEKPIEEEPAAADDLVAKLTTISNEVETDELTEEDLLELLSEDEE
jgi:hypothetical protein